MKLKREEKESQKYKVTLLRNEGVKLEYDYGTFQLRSYTDVDPDESGVSVYTNRGKFKYPLPNLTLDISDTDSMNKIIEQIGERENS